VARRTVPSRRAGERLGRDFFAADAVALARALLGAHLVRVLGDGREVRVRIHETEAYTGVEDRASHAYGGRRTARNGSMWAAPGTAYVYFVYGMHHCFNIACGREGEPPAVLVRGGEVIGGVEAAAELRGWEGRRAGRFGRHLADGPAKLCRAMAIDRALDGADLTRDGRIWVEAGDRAAVREGEVRRTARIGVGYAGEWAAEPLRWVWERGPWSAREKMGKPAPESGGMVARVRGGGA
jgi:DNA-3-methyladenine glycosylase